MAAVAAMRWRGDALELLDQRLLPGTTRHVVCRTAAEVAQAIRDMVVRGAPAIGCAAAYGIALDAARGAPLEPAFESLARSRPTAVNLFWALERMRARVGTGPAALEQEARAIFDEDVAANRAIGEHGARLVADGARVLTYCNTGALATAGHGTALGVVRSVRDAGKRVSVIACETRPYLQGARLTAWELLQEGIPATLVTDNAAGYLMSRGEVDVAIVGADRVAANGDVANKIGTYTLAVLAARHGLPFYVAAPLSTFDRRARDGTAIPIEERAGDELVGYGSEVWAPKGIALRNPAFDVTPAALIAALICEHGVLRAPYAHSIERALADVAR